MLSFVGHELLSLNTVEYGIYGTVLAQGVQWRPVVKLLYTHSSTYK